MSKIIQSGLRCAACVLIISLTEAIIHEAWRPCRQGKSHAGGRRLHRSIKRWRECHARGVEGDWRRWWIER